MTLTVADKGTDDSNNLTLHSADTTDTIAAVDGALTAGMTGGGWNISGGLLSNKAITTAGQNVYVGTSTTGAEEKDIEMTYNFATDKDQAAGTYANVITYTVSANAAPVEP